MICTRGLMVYHPQSAHFHRSPTLTEVAELSSLTHCSLDHSSLDGTGQSLKQNLPLNISRNLLLKKINDRVVILRLRLYREKFPRQKGHPHTWPTLGEPTFHPFPYKTWRTVYTSNKKLASRTNFSPYRHFGSPSRFNSVKTIRACAGAVLDNQSMRERCWLGKNGLLVSHINAR